MLYKRSISGRNLFSCNWSIPFLSHFLTFFDIIEEWRNWLVWVAFECLNAWTPCVRIKIVDFLQYSWTENMMGYLEMKSRPCRKILREKLKYPIKWNCSPSQRHHNRFSWGISLALYCPSENFNSDSIDFNPVSLICFH